MFYFACTYTPFISYSHAHSPHTHRLLTHTHPLTSMYIFNTFDFRFACTLVTTFHRSLLPPAYGHGKEASKTQNLTTHLPAAAKSCI